MPNDRQTFDAMWSALGIPSPSKTGVGGSGNDCPKNPPSPEYAALVRAVRAVEAFRSKLDADLAYIADNATLVPTDTLEAVQLTYLLWLESIVDGSAAGALDCAVASALAKIQSGQVAGDADVGEEAARVAGVP